MATQKKFITTKYGTKIDITGLSQDQINKVRNTAEANGAYGGKGAALADKMRGNAGGGGNGGAGVTPRTTSATQKNPYGTSTTTTDENGNVTTEEKLTDTQQGLLDKDQALAGAAKDIANNQLEQGNFDTNFVPKTSERTSGADLEADRARIEEALYAKMTRDIDSQEKMGVEQRGQDLLDEGIPFSNDPESAYQQRMRDVTDRYSRDRESARLSSIQQGGEEYQRNFGINEQRIANEYSQGMGTHQQQLSDINNFSQMGAQVQAPPGMDPATWAQLSAQEKQRISNEAIARMQNRTQNRAIDASNRSSGGTTQENSAFPSGGL